jgi:hypothetical protein
MLNFDGAAVDSPRREKATATEYARMILRNEEHDRQDMRGDLEH